MTINKYIGSRYVPLYIGVHDKNISYEPLSIVSNETKTETYTSTQAVPVGVELGNETYWVQSGWSNADMKIATATDFVDSTTNSNLSAEKTDDGYKVKLSDSNAFASGGTLDTAQTLNTMLDTGRYIFKPVDCAGVPDAIASLETPAELEITDYLATEGATAQIMQKITAYDDDNAAMFVRTYDNEKWSEWKMIGGNGASTEGNWEDITQSVSFANVLDGTAKVVKNSVAKLVMVSFKWDTTKINENSKNVLATGLPIPVYNNVLESSFSGAAPLFVNQPYSFGASNFTYIISSTGEFITYGGTNISTIVNLVSVIYPYA